MPEAPQKLSVSKDDTGRLVLRPRTFDDGSSTAPVDNPDQTAGATDELQKQQPPTPALDPYAAAAIAALQKRNDQFKAELRGVTGNLLRRWSERVEPARPAHSERFDGMMLLQVVSSGNCAVNAKKEMIKFVRLFTRGHGRNVGAGGDPIPTACKDAERRITGTMLETFVSAISL